MPLTPPPASLHYLGRITAYLRGYPVKPWLAQSRAYHYSQPLETFGAQSRSGRLSPEPTPTASSKLSPSLSAILLATETTTAGYKTSSLTRGPHLTRNLATSSTPNEESRMYTTSFAFFEAIWEAGVTHCFVNLGSDHPSIIEAMVKGQREQKGSFPRIITCPNEVSTIHV